MRTLSDQPPLSPEEYKGLQQAIACLIENFGWGPVKAEVNRRPKPQEVGRPKVWDEARLYTLWLIVETWSIRGDYVTNETSRRIGRACKELAKIGGLIQDRQNSSSALVSGSETIRRLYYEAESELAEYEARHKICLDGDDPRTLKERLREYAEILRFYEFFFATGLAKASEIVLYELFQDGVYGCDPPPLPPLHPPEMARVPHGDMIVIDRLPPPVRVRHRGVKESPHGSATLPPSRRHCPKSGF